MNLDITTEDLYAEMRRLQAENSALRIDKAVLSRGFQALQQEVNRLNAELAGKEEADVRQEGESVSSPAPAASNRASRRANDNKP